MVGSICNFTGKPGFTNVYFYSISLGSKPIPNALQGLFVLVAADIGAMVALIAAFYFVGLIGTIGSDLIADWGHMLSVSRDWIVGTPSNAFEYWYTFLPASLAIVLFTVGWSLIADGLRDVLDPRTR